MHVTEPTWHEFRTVTLDFADTAPVRYVTEQIVKAPRQAVWDAFADAESWSAWFPHVNRAWYEGEKPWGVGTIRKSDVAGCIHDETMVVWDEPRRWGYIINRATEALSTAQIEVTEFEDAPGGTKVRWILACDPPREGMAYLAGGESFEAFLARLFDDAMRRLEAYIATATGAVTRPAGNAWVNKMTCDGD